MAARAPVASGRQTDPSQACASTCNFVTLADQSLVGLTCTIHLFKPLVHFRASGLQVTARPGGRARWGRLSG